MTTKYLAAYRHLVELAPDDTEREIAAAYVAHEETLAAFARRDQERTNLSSRSSPSRTSPRLLPP